MACCRENFTFTLLGYYAALSGSYLPTFRDNLPAPNLQGSRSSSWSLNMGPIGCPETSVDKYQIRCVTAQKSEDVTYMCDVMRLYFSYVTYCVLTDSICNWLKINFGELCIIYIYRAFFIINLFISIQQMHYTFIQWFLAPTYVSTHLVPSSGGRRQFTIFNTFNCFSLTFTVHNYCKPLKTDKLITINIKTVIFSAGDLQ